MKLLPGTLGFELHSRRLSGRHARLSRSDVSGRSAQGWREGTNARLVDAFFEICDREDIPVLIECGAHEAAASVRFIRAGIGRRAIALEANPHTYSALTAKAAELGVEALQAAVGARPGEGVINIPTSGTDGGLLAVDASMRVHRKWAAKNKSIHTVPVEIVTVDRVATDGATVGPIALWVDVEGFATEALEGAEGLLREQRIAVALVEVEAEEVYGGGRDLSAVIRILRQGGLRPIARDHQFRTSNVFNVLFAHPRPQRSVRSLRRRIESVANADGQPSASSTRGSASAASP